jgi:hypothetical protein
VGTDWDVLPFAFLVYREDSERWGGTWIARSVLTGHLAEARTEDAAVANLQRAIDAAVFMAADMGQTPRQWYEAQEMDESEYVAMFCRLVSSGVQMRSVELKNSHCRLETSIAISRAA